MKFKLKITKAEYEALDDAKKGLYTADGENYKLDVDDVEVAAEMRRGRDREKARADALDAEKKELEARISALEEAGEQAKRKSGDITEIEKGWQKKLDKAKADGDAAVMKLKKQLETVMIDGELAKIASEIFVKPGRDVRLLKDRVYVEFEGENAVLRVRDKEGKASALTLEDLKKETVDNADYKDILVGSKATGSGGSGGNNGGGAAKKPHELNDAERTELFRTNPTEFNRLFPQAT